MNPSPQPYETELGEAGGCKRRLTVRVGAAQVARELDDLVRDYAKRVRIAGFRRGHVPPALVRKRFAKELEEEVRDHLVRHGLRQGLDEHKVRPLHDPVIEAPSVKEGEPYGFTALFEIKPEIRLGEYKGLSVAIEKQTVSDEDVEKALVELRESLARFVPVDPRPAVDRDFLQVDLQGHFEDEKGRDFNHEAVVIEIGSETNLPEFNEALLGMVPGDTRSFVVSYPADFPAEGLAGHPIRYSVTLKEIKARQLPAADDELPKDLGKSGTLADLREEIRKDLLAARDRAAEARARDALVRQLIERNPVDVPEVLVEEQVNMALEEMVRRMIVRGINPAKVDLDWNDLRDKERSRARTRVLGAMILDEIGAREGIDVTDAEISRRIAEETAHRGAGGAEIRKRLEQPGSRQLIKNQLLREKSLDFLMKNATISQ